MYRSARANLVDYLFTWGGGQLCGTIVKMSKLNQFYLYFGHSCSAIKTYRDVLLTINRKLHIEPGNVDLYGSRFAR